MSGRSADDGAAKLAALHDRLVTQVAGLVSGDDWRRWLDVAQRFPTYSFNNCLLIAAQRPDASAVAGYRAWQSMQRQVGRGERGIQILAPVTRRVPAEDLSKEAADATDARRVVGFRVTHVWDVAQTTGEPLPEPPHPLLLEGQAPQGLWDSLGRVLQSRGFVLERGDCGEANGWTAHLARTVRVRDDLNEAQAVKTLAHEAAHVLLHGPISDGPRPSREQAEVEAESVAYIVTSVHGLSSDNYSFAYVASWATNDGADAETTVRAAAQRVLRAARDILAVTGGLEPVVVKEALASRITSAAVQTVKMQTAKDAPSVIVPLARLADVNTESAAFFAAALSESAPATAALAARGVPGAAADTYQLGYAPAGWTALAKHLREQGFTDAEMTAAGVATMTKRGTLIDTFRDRLVFPVFKPDGEYIVGFIGRALTADERTPKYLNTPHTPLYGKSECLYGLGLPQMNDCLAAGAVPVLVEGPLDAIAVTLDSGGTHVGLAPCGTALSPGQVDALARVTPLQGRRLVVAFDGDVAGRAATVRSYDLLRSSGCIATYLKLRDGEDPAFLAQRVPGGLSGMCRMAPPLIDAVIDSRIDEWATKLHWAEGQVGAIRSCAPIIATLDQTQVGRQVARVAVRVGVDPGLVTGEVISALESSLQLQERHSAEAVLGGLPLVSSDRPERAMSLHVHGHPQTQLPIVTQSTGSVVRR